MLSAVAVLMIAISLPARPFSEVYLGSVKIGSTYGFGGLQMAKVGRPPGIWRVSYNGRPWTLKERISGEADFVVSPAARLGLVLSNGLVCRTFAGKQVWHDGFTSYDDPGGLVLNGDVVVYSTGVATNYGQLGYSSEAELLAYESWRRSSNVVEARKLDNGGRIWAAKTLSVGVPIAPGLHRTYLALRLPEPLRRVALRRRRFWLDVRSLDTGSRRGSFRIPRFVTSHIVSDYLMGIPWISAERCNGYVCYVFEKRGFEVQGERNTKMILRLDDNGRRAVFRIGRRVWVSRAVR